MNMNVVSYKDKNKLVQLETMATEEEFYLLAHRYIVLSNWNPNQVCNYLTDMGFFTKENIA
jgi:hypothetical protein